MTTALLPKESEILIMDPDDQKANRREGGFAGDQARLSLTEITAQFEPMTLIVGELLFSFTGGGATF